MAPGQVGKELEPGGESYLRLSLGREFSAQEIENCGLRTRPSVGSVIRERIFTKGDLPPPFRPMMPTTSPRRTSKETFLRAQKSSFEDARLSVICSLLSGVSEPFSDLRSSLRAVGSTRRGVVPSGTESEPKAIFDLPFGKRRKSPVAFSTNTSRSATYRWSRRWRSEYFLPRFSTVIIASLIWNGSAIRAEIA